jgi:hypothetical protein
LRTAATFVVEKLHRLHPSHRKGKTPFWHQAPNAVQNGSHESKRDQGKYKGQQVNGYQNVNLQVKEEKAYF